MTYSSQINEKWMKERHVSRFSSTNQPAFMEVASGGIIYGGRPITKLLDDRGMTKKKPCQTRSGRIITNQEEEVTEIKELDIDILEKSKEKYNQMKDD
ncbi:9039_t:CDS:2 [Diversispora eburnea]|uniref:9039_t:CDS:1 n=1 Tax=Diversispora eburnea TaxID=1213867 RepID=A0A9N9CA31_9GLOM|nr:9039_t:CDS:2 [Diversispora eburnea]